MKISILIEGKTELAFKPHLIRFLESRLAGKMPKIRFISYDGRIPKQDKLRRTVKNLLYDGSDAVIALTDVYTGDDNFKDAEDAKNKMKQWVGDIPQFYPHVAKHDFEAWLLPYWSEIQKLAKHDKSKPGNNPEEVNHNKPPSRHLMEIFEAGKCRKSYNKPRDANRILKGQDLLISAQACPELKKFLYRIIRLCDKSKSPDDMKRIDLCIIDKKDEGRPREVVQKYCECMNSKMDESETESVTQWEKTHPKEQKECSDNVGWK